VAAVHPVANACTLFSGCEPRWSGQVTEEPEVCVMTDLNNVLDGLMKSGVLGNLAGGVAGGALAGLLTGKGSKLARAGALAAVGGLAWKAWQSYQEQQTAQPGPQTGEPPRRASAASPGRLGTMPPPAIEPSHELLMMRAMIAAAHADGHIDAKEQARIFTEVDRLGLEADDKAVLFDELRRPLGLRELVELTPDATAGAEVYAASMLALDPEQPVSARYLDELARQLALPAELVDAVRAEVAGTVGAGRTRS
jgi:uncharacterized membrane protein YebE (DUF533 family)